MLPKIYCKLNKNFEVDCDDEKCSCILKKILSIYRNAGIPVIRHDRIIKKVNNLIDEHRNLKRNMSRKSETELKKQQDFQNSLDNLFDVLPADVEKEIEHDKKETRR